MLQRFAFHFLVSVSTMRADNVGQILQIQAGLRQPRTLSYCSNPVKHRRKGVLATKTLEIRLNKSAVQMLQCSWPDSNRD